MKLQRFNALALFIFLINTMSVSGMKRSNYDPLDLESSTYNSIHSLICLPGELQQQIVFPCDIMVMQVEEDNADELNEHIKTFFRFNSVCKYFNKNLKFPWLNLELVTKNKMMQEVNLLITKLSCKECLDDDYGTVFRHGRTEKISACYKRYCTIALALVCSGAGADITDCSSTTLISKSVHAKDELAVALLLNYNADPYQQSFFENQIIALMIEEQYQMEGNNKFKISYEHENLPAICFRSPTVAIAKLFLEKVDKQNLLSLPRSKQIISEFTSDFYPPEIMQLWLDYGIDARHCLEDNSQFHWLIGECYHGHPIDNCLRKLELLLNIIPDIVNMKNNDGRTPVDQAEVHMQWSTDTAENYVKIIALFREYGGKTAKELEENTQLINHIRDIQ